MNNVKKYSLFILSHPPATLMRSDCGQVCLTCPAEALAKEDAEAARNTSVAIIQIKAARSPRSVSEVGQTLSLS